MDRIGCCVFVFFLALAVSKANECYVCSTLTDSGCGDDPFDKTSSTAECRMGSCLKTKSGDMVVRACGLPVGGTECNEEGDNVVCQCKGNLCNDATVKVVSMATLIFAVFINLAFRM